MRKRLHALFCLAVLSFVSFMGKAQLNASFTASVTSGCAPFVVQFTNTSTGTGINSYLWKFGNGFTSTLQNPSTTYLNDGTYDVTLIVSNGTVSDTTVLVGFITAFPKPIVNFTTLDSGYQCGPNSVDFVDASITGTTGPSLYQWDFGGGTVITGSTATYAYTSLGPKTITLSVTNSAGCSNSRTKSAYVIFVDYPTASFTSTNPNSCQVPSTVSFFDGSINVNNYFWDFGDGTTSTQQNPTHTYNAAGSYDVMFVGSNQGCSDTVLFPAYANLGVQLSAGFTMSDTAVCVGSPVTLTNTSVPSTGGSTWYFGDGTSVSSPDALKTYNTPGTYQIMLVVNFINCTDTTYQTINVNPGPVADFVGSPLTACAGPLTVNFTNQTTGGTGFTYQWTLGQSGATSTATNPTRTYTGTGNFTVSLTATNPANGCTSTATKPAYVKINTIPPASTFSVTPTTGCQPLNVAFNPSTIAVPSFTTINSYSWDFGDGSPLSTAQTPTHTYATTDTFTATLTFSVAAGCNYVRTRNIIVSSKPTASMDIANPSVCLKDSFTLTNTTPGTNNTVTWYVYPNGSPMTSFYVYTGDVVKSRISTPGSYNVTLLVNSGGCVDTLTYADTLKISPPNAAFGVGFSCTNRKEVSLTNNSLGATSYSWDFGDGSPVQTIASPTYTYANNGDYQITLVTSNATSGCVDTARIPVRIYDLNPSFTAISDTIICKGEEVTLQAVVDTNATNYGWDFGDGSPLLVSGSFISSYIYPTPGLYDVSLILFDSRGCSDTVTKTGLVRVSGPTAAFNTTPNSPIAGCAPLTVNFTDASTPNPTSTAITARDWFFGNSVTASGNLTTTSQTYTSAGSYIVTLRVTDADGCKDSIDISSPILVSKPNATFMASDTVICRGKTINFTTGTFSNPTYPSPLAGWSFNWNFGGNPSLPSTAVRHPSVPFNNNGTYNVRLIVTSNIGCKDTFIRTSYIQVSPLNVDFYLSDSTPTCPPKTVAFVNTSELDAQVFDWSFGNGNTSTFSNPGATYTQGGSYTIQLIGQTADGQCIDTAVKNLTVLGPSGSISYTPLAGCNPLPVSFTVNLQNAQSYVWDLNNGFVSTPVATNSNNYTATNNFTYTTTGKYVPFVLASTGGCNVPIFGTDTVRVDKINGNFNIVGNNQCGTANVTFNAVFNATISGVQSVWWSYGDGTFGSGLSSTHFYPAPGVYEVKMGITTQLGCVDTAIKYVTVKPLPVIDAGNNASICPGGTTPLNATGAGTGGTYTWTPAGSLSCANCASPNASPASTTTYTVTGTASNGCSASDQVTVTVTIPPTVFAGNDVLICNGAYASLNATGAATYSWTPTATLSCTTCPNPSANPTTNTSYIVTGTDANGCIDKDTVVVNVSPLPTVSGGPNRNICIGDTVSLIGTGASSYVWTLAGGAPATNLSCTNCANPVANPTTTTIYRVQGTGITGAVCSDTAIVTVFVSPLPSISAGANQSICFGNSAQLQASGAGPGGSYQWTPTPTLDNPSIDNPLATPTTSTTYTVKGTNAGGCFNTSTVLVSVNPKPTVNGGANVGICVNGSTQLNATGADSYVWSPNLGLSSTTIPNPIASPFSTITYSVVGQNAFGCLDTADVEVFVNPLPTVVASGAQTICPGASTPLQATGAVTYSWSPANSLNNPNIDNPIASPPISTTYTVTGTDANGCTGTDAVLVTISTPPNVTAGGNQTICSGAGTQLLATGASTYSWTPNTTLNADDIPDPFATPTTTTTYTVTGTDIIGCSDTAQVTVFISPLPNVDAGANVSICFGDTVSLLATGAVSYSWAPSITLSCLSCPNPIASPITTTSYVVEGTDALGCVNDDVVTVTVLPLPNVTVNPAQTICPGASASLQAQGAVAYNWSPGTSLNDSTVAGPIATPTAQTTYTVTGTSDSGCVNTASTTVSFFPAPNITAGTNVSICIGSNIQLQASGGASYNWLPSPTLSCLNCSNPIASPTVTTTYTLTGLSAQGCPDTATITVFVNPLPIIKASNDTLICPGVPIPISATGGAFYSWSPIAGLSCINCPNPTATTNTPVTYVVTGTDANGCSNKDSLEISIIPGAPIVASPDRMVCLGDTVHLTATGASNYSWTPSTGLSCSNCSNPIASPTVSTNYIVSGVASNGCTGVDTVKVDLYPLANVSAGSNITVCRGDSATLQATGAITYTWSPATSLSCTNCASPTTAPISNIIYNVVGVDGNGCVDSAKVSVAVIQRNQVNFSKGDSICVGASVNLSASGGDAYVWTPATGLDNPNIANPVATPTSTTTYQVLISQGQCFSDTGFVTIEVLPTPTVDAGPDRNLVLGTGLQLQPVVNDATIYLWTPALGLSCTTCLNPTAQPSKTTTYTLRVSNTLGCSAKDEVTVFVSCDSSYLTMPNTFTPNNDGHNDKFYPQGTGLSRVFQFRIFNRWGQLVYEAYNIPMNNPAVGWDGRYKGEELPADVYVYYIVSRCDAGEFKEIKGDISLIR